MTYLFYLHEIFIIILSAWALMLVYVACVAKQMIHV